MRTSSVGAMCIVLLAGCSSSAAPAADPGALHFPSGFLFGTASAGFQHEMGCPTLPASICEDPNSDWYAFVTSAAIQADSGAHLFPNIEPPSAGPGFRELYASDLDLARNALHNNAFRLSIEWSRVFPTPTDGIDGYAALKQAASPQALQWYHTLFAALHKRGLTPLVTLNHYTLPTWIHDGVGCHQDFAHCTRRGWVDADRTIKEISKYAGFCAAEFGAEVDLWATENEPLAVVLPGYMLPSDERSNPPALMLHQAEAKTVFNALITAHARMYDAVKANDKVDADGDGQAARVGLVYAMAPVRAADPQSALDVAAARNVFYLWNLAFLDAIALGKRDAALSGNQVLEPGLQGRLDFLGINYYVRVTVTGADAPVLPDFTPLSTFDPTTIGSGEAYPHGIFEDVTFAWKRYHLPMIITENGTIWNTEAPNPEGDKGYYVRHLTWLARAIAQGADVRGYFVWSMVDNYEWNRGMKIKTGLYAVDPKDPKKLRVRRPTADVYAAIAGARAVSKTLQDAYPAPEETWVQGTWEPPTP